MEASSYRSDADELVSSVDTAASGNSLSQSSAGSSGGEQLPKEDEQRGDKSRCGEDPAETKVLAENGREISLRSGRMGAVVGAGASVEQRKQLRAGGGPGTAT